MNKLKSRFNVLVWLLLIIFTACQRDTVPTTVTDIEGNTYKVISIGDQYWMAENLKTTRFRDGSQIPLVQADTQWSNLESSAYCGYFVYIPDYNPVYGNLTLNEPYYNWYAVTDSRQLCPVGWHVPSTSEWMVLVDFLGGYEIAGGKMKAEGVSHWKAPNTGADNSSGFTALPVGGRYIDGFYFAATTTANWWSTTEDSSPLHLGGDHVSVSYDSDDVSGGYTSKDIGLSVRCVKD